MTVAFKSRQAIAQYPVAGMRGREPYNLPAAVFSDDSAMAFHWAEKEFAGMQERLPAFLQVQNALPAEIARCGRLLTGEISPAPERSL